MTSKPKPRTITLKPSGYQPSKTELEERVKLEIPGKDAHERALHLARAVLQPAKVQFKKD